MPSAKSLVLDLLSTMRGGSMPVRDLVAAGSLFDLAENSLRVALARLLRSGLVERDERGHYRLGSAAVPVQTRVAGWSRVTDKMTPWDGGWIAIHTAALGRTDRKALRMRDRALRLFGFRNLMSGIEIRPDNLMGGCDRIRRDLYAIGLETDACVYRLSGLDTRHETQAHKLWDVDALLTSYRELTNWLKHSAERLPEMDTPRARAESFLLGGQAIRAIVFDPLLPEPICPNAEREELVRALSDYDRLGRAIWQGRFDHTLIATPFSGTAQGA